MKKIFNKIAILSIAALAISTSCKNEEKYIFEGEGSAAERLTESCEKYFKALNAQGGKWEMLYFANEDEVGYNFFVDFDADGSVLVAADNKLVAGEERSLYEMIADNGPVLTFNSFNHIFHHFSTPDVDPLDPNTSLGEGHLGDYEFMVMEATDNSIRLKGKKRGYTIMLNRLDESTTPAEYFQEVDAMRNSIFSTVADKMYLESEGVRYIITKPTSEVISCYPEGGDDVTEVSKFTAITTRTGLRFMLPFKGFEEREKFSVQTFTMNEFGYLVCDDDQVTTIKGMTVNERLNIQEMTWTINPEKLGGAWAEAYEAFVTGLSEKRYGALKSMSLLYNKKEGSYKFQWEVGRYKCEFEDNYTVEGDNVTFTIGSGDRNAETIAKNVPAVRNFLDMLDATKFVVKMDTQLNPEMSMRFEDATSAGDYFYVNGTK